MILKFEKTLYKVKKTALNNLIFQNSRHWTQYKTNQI